MHTRGPYPGGSCSASKQASHRTAIAGYTAQAGRIYGESVLCSDCLSLGLSALLTLGAGGQTSTEARKPKTRILEAGQTTRAAKSLILCSKEHVRESIKVGSQSNGSQAIGGMSLLVRRQRLSTQTGTIDCP